MRALLTSALFILSVIGLHCQNRLSGYVIDQMTREAMVEAHIFIPDLHKGTTTNMDGFFEMSNLPQGSFLVEVGYLGYSTQVIRVTLGSETPLNVELATSVVEMSQVVVTGISASLERELNPIPTLVINQISSHGSSYSNIIDAIARKPGIAQITTGGAISKPVIRGLGYNRVVVLNNNIRQEGQQWGDEHGIEIDEFSVDRVEILKGPGSLMYGSDAMAGVIHFLAPKPVSEGNIIGQILANYQTNDHMQGFSFMNAGHLNGINWLARMSSKRAGNYTNKYDGQVYNSGFNGLNFNGTIGVNKKWGYSHFHISQFGQSIGLVEGERDEFGFFTRPVVVDGIALEEQSVRGSDLDGYKIGIPSQDILHQKLSSNSKIFLKESILALNLAFQQNTRKEFGNPFDMDEAELYFLLNTFNFDIRYSLPENGDWKTAVGIGGMQQNSYNKGEEFLIPEYGVFDIGAFLFTQKSYDKFHISGGVRYDIRSLEALPLYLDDQGEETVASDPDGSAKFKGFKNTFSNISASLGSSYQFNDKLTGKFNISRGFRSPNMAELGSNGIHEGTFRYELGNSELKPETSLQVDAGLIFNNEHLSFELDLFHNSIQNYIYLKKLKSVAGGDSILDLSDPAPVFQFVQGNAHLFGAEFIVDIHPHPLDWLHFENSFSFVRGKQTNQPDSLSYLPFMPAPEVRSEIRADLKKMGSYFKHLYLSLGFEYTFKQSRVLSAFGTESPTPGYGLLNAGIGADVKGKTGRNLFTVSIAGHNLLDKTYQSHLSRLKYAPENPATGRNGVYNMGRNVNLKLEVPFTLRNKTN